MNLALDPQTEADLLAIAASKKVSPEAYVTELISLEAKLLHGLTPNPEANSQQSLHEFLMNSPLRGADLEYERAKDTPRLVEIE